MSANVEVLKDAIIAEVASDVLKIRDDLSLVTPLISQMLEAFPKAFDSLQGGLIETLSQINEGIEEAGGDRIEYVRGQLGAFIEVAIRDAFAQNSAKINQLAEQYERHNNAAAKNLKSQFDEVAEGLKSVRKEIDDIRIPKWAKIFVPLAFVIAIVSTGLITWHYASYKEAVYMREFIKFGTEKARSSK
jgi:hypothetical protein